MQSVNIGREEEKRRRGEQGNKVKEKERGVMAEEEEERVEAGEVVKERGEQGNKVKQKERGVITQLNPSTRISSTKKFIDKYFIDNVIYLQEIYRQL